MALILVLIIASIVYYINRKKFTGKTISLKIWGFLIYVFFVIDITCIFSICSSFNCAPLSKQLQQQVDTSTCDDWLLKAKHVCSLLKLFHSLQKCAKYECESKVQSSWREAWFQSSWLMAYHFHIKHKSWMFCCCWISVWGVLSQLRMNL